MSNTVDYAQIHAFSDELHLLVAQMGSKLRPHVRVRTNVTGKTDHWERLGHAELQAVTSRHMTTPLLNPAHSRRRLNMADRAGAIALDQLDEIKMLIQPQNDYARVLAGAVGRVWDDLLITALTGAATTVDNTDTTGSATLGSAQQIAAGSTGLTFEKVNQAARILNQNNAPQEGRVFVTSPQGLEDLLAETEVTSSDFATLQALMTGSIENRVWMGFTWVMSTRLSRSSTTRTCVAYHRDGMGLSIGRDLKIEVDKRPDLMNATQVLVQVSAGAVRIEEELVVQVDITES